MELIPRAQRGQWLGRDAALPILHGKAEGTPFSPETILPLSPSFAPYLRGHLYANRIKGSEMRDRLPEYSPAGSDRRCTSEQPILSSQVREEEGWTQGIKP